MNRWAEPVRHYPKSKDRRSVSMLLGWQFTANDAGTRLWRFSQNPWCYGQGTVLPGQWRTVVRSTRKLLRQKSGTAFLRRPTNSRGEAFGTVSLLLLFLLPPPPLLGNLHSVQADQSRLGGAGGRARSYPKHHDRRATYQPGQSPLGPPAVCSHRPR